MSLFTFPLISLVAFPLVLTASIDTLPFYILSSLSRGSLSVLTGPTNTGRALVLMSNIDSAGDGKQWRFDRNRDGSYHISNKVFSNYQLNANELGRPYLARANNSDPTQRWELDTWPDGTYKLWRQCCGSEYSLTALRKGSVANVTTGHDGLHHWLFRPVIGGTSTAPVPTVSRSTAPPDDGSGLTSGAKAGIGVGVGVGVTISIAVLVTGFCVQRWRKRRLGGANGPPELKAAASPHKDQATAPSSPAELAVVEAPVELALERQ